MVMMTHESWKMNPSILETCPNIRWIGTFPCHIRDLEFPTFAQVVMREELQKLRKDHAERVQELQGAAEETVVIRTHFGGIKWILKRIQMMQLLVISSDFFPPKKYFIVWVGFTKLLCIDWLTSTVTGFQTWKNDDPQKNGCIRIGRKCCSTCFCLIITPAKFMSFLKMNKSYQNEIWKNIQRPLREKHFRLSFVPWSLSKIFLKTLWFWVAFQILAWQPSPPISPTILGCLRIEVSKRWVS